MVKVGENYTASNHYISALFHLAAEKGLDGKALLQRADIDPDIIDSPDIRVKTEKLAIVVQGLWDSLQDENMGLTNYPCQPGSYYMMGKLTVQQPNLRKALELGLRYYGFITKGFCLVLDVGEEIATLKVQLHEPELDREHLLSEMTLLAWHRYASWLIAESLPLTEVCFDYPAPEHAHEYIHLYPGIHRFQCTYFGFSFHKKYLQREIVQTESTLKDFMSRCPVELFLRQKTDVSLVHELRLLLKKQIKEEGLSDIIDAAKALHLTKRTLIRKLKDEGTSYQQIKDLVRRDVAIFFLTQQNISIEEITGKVGFSDPSTFTRAFKTWTGFSPSKYRANGKNINID